jgi:Zinc carboxypeptidase
MRRRFAPWFLALAVGWVPMAMGASATADIAPPWCGSPETDAAENLPDGTDPSDPAGSFPHIPYYAIGCTLDSIQSRSGGRMTVEVIGQSATGRNLYLVTINALETKGQRKEYKAWRKIRKEALDDPREARRRLRDAGGNAKVPIFIQGGIHGNEYEGVDAAMQIIERLATTPRGSDPLVDKVLDHAIVLVNVIQNPDGRVAGTRANGNGFDLNRDYLTQSQSETRASVSIMQRWLPTEGLDLHGYYTPTLVDGTTKPHNPGLEYDLFVKWNQPRLDVNETALAAIGQGMQRPVNDWCSDADLPPCPPGESPGPAVAEGWDDWGPFYTATYMQLTGIDGSTVEMCQSVSQCGGRAGAREAQKAVTWSTMDFVVDNRSGMLADQLRVFRRGVKGAARVSCCEPPIVGDHNWMTEYPRAYIIPLRLEQQRSPAEANNLVQWLLFNGIDVERAKARFQAGGVRYAKDTYIVRMAQALRGLADTALNLGTDISPRINTLYAPPAAWSHGYLWGADVVTLPPGQRLRVETKEIKQPSALQGGTEGTGAAYALRLDSPTAVRTVNALVGGGHAAQAAMQPFASSSGVQMPAGSVIFSGSDRGTLDIVGRREGLWFRAVGTLPAVEPIDRVPRIAVLTAAVNQDVWALRDLGFTADAVPTGGTSQLNNPGAADPLLNYDVVFNTANWPTGMTARTRLTAFFNSGGGYIGAGAGGANFIGSTGANQFSGLTVATATGGGQSGIVRWVNSGGAASPVVGAYPGQDTAIVDPPTWYTATPSSATVDGRLTATDYFAAGLWRFAARAATVPNAPVIVHGASTQPGSQARITTFAMNPLYRADPEREWPAVAGAAYWSDR